MKGGDFMNQVIFWLILLLLLVAIEVATLGLTTIWFAGGALIAVIAAALNAPLFLQIALFLAVSVVLLVFTRPVAVRYFNKDRTKTNVESLVGQKGIVVKEVNNLEGTGQVSLNGMEWSARSIDGKGPIPEGAVVVVREIRGVKLMVQESAADENDCEDAAGKN